MPPRTRATARAENSRLTPTVLQRRSCGVPSTPSFRFRYSSPHSERRFIGSTSPSAQIEEVDDGEIGYEERGNIDDEINPIGNAESSADEAEAEVLPQAPPVQPTPPPGTPQAQPRATPRASAPPGTTNNWDILDAIIELGRTARQHRQDGQAARIREPNMFDGTNPKKLKGFVFLCNMDFRTRPNAFMNDHQKINYMISFLKGSALDCFEPSLIGDSQTEPGWTANLDAFIDELQINFGSWDKKAEAELALEKLTMNDNYKATRFFVEFYRLSALVDYNENALLRKAYTALLKRIKDGLIHFDKPQSLDELRNLAQRIDMRYWERKAEQVCQGI